MVWFSSSPSQAAPEPSRDGGFIAPDRTARQQCWDGRDNFFKCLDKVGIIDSVKEDDRAKKSCAPELKEFEKACAESWVTYFKKRRVMEYQRDQTLKKLNAEGATPMDVGGGQPRR
ncbi:related to Cytochrome c oxidase subunit 6B new16 [Lecanosticta acicola]|uniref:Related to Cytochrome c oxidase subunit 6B new16 n=1 Tax=Lecanosticta acicola TaxID=111012 RepID=A0AAI9E816_9PEZI|nr:related to Cytochrome c oxidase subunit 6B new16 [Lecanosticta acicola]